MGSDIPTDWPIIANPPLIIKTQKKIKKAAISKTAKLDSLIDDNDVPSDISDRASNFTVTTYKSQKILPLNSRQANVQDASMEHEAG